MKSGSNNPLVELKNISFVYITHRLNELFDIVNELTVLRNGEIISQGTIEQYDLKKVIQFMVPPVNGNSDIENKPIVAEEKEERANLR